MIRASRQSRSRVRPAAPAHDSPRDGAVAGRLALRLAVTRGGLGLELDAAADDAALRLGPLVVRELSVSLVGLSFPVDLSGGVPRFRHRRGALERLVVAASIERLLAELAPRLRGVLGKGSPAVSVAPVAGGVAIGLVEGTRALAFEALFAPRDGDVRWVVAAARGVGLDAPAMALALRAADGIAGAYARRSGALVEIPAAAAKIARSVLPAAGARAPDARAARWGELVADATGFHAACDAAQAPARLGEHVVRALELAELASRADDALAGGDLDDARARYVELLERAPRHPEISLRIAEIDAFATGRTEAALATLVDAMPALDAGAVGAALLLASGDREGARAAHERAAERELLAPIASLHRVAAAALAPTAPTRLASLDAAVARSPGLAAARWARFDARLDVGDLAGALADAEHLEAGARGSHARHEVWRRAGEAVLARGDEARAVAWFERALRYRPDGGRALAGLGRSLLAAGRAGRALDLLARAVELGARQGLVEHDLVLVLARALASVASDRPAAIARARSVPLGCAEAVEARALEARWRGELGDLAGASLAWGRMRDTVELTPDVAPDAAAAWLAEAARFELDHEGDARAAERHLAVALRLAPRDASIAAAFRACASRVARDERGARERVAHPPVAAPHHPPPSAEEPGLPLPAAEDEAAPQQVAGEHDEALVERLVDRVRANPSDRPATLALADALGRLGRDLELFALLSARLEDARADERGELLPRRRAVLERLAQAAREAGNDDEADLYEAAATGL